MENWMTLHTSTCCTPFADELEEQEAVVVGPGDPLGDGVRAAVVKIAAEFPRFGYRSFGRGRDWDCSQPHAQIRTCAITASGSYLGCLA